MPTAARTASAPAKGHGAARRVVYLQSHDRPLPAGTGLLVQGPAAHRPRFLAWLLVSLICLLDMGREAGIAFLTLMPPFLAASEIAEGERRGGGGAVAPFAFVLSGLSNVRCTISASGGGALMTRTDLPEGLGHHPIALAALILAMADSARLGGRPATKGAFPAALFDRYCSAMTLIAQALPHEVWGHDRAQPLSHGRAAAFLLHFAARVRDREGAQALLDSLRSRPRDWAAPWTLPLAEGFAVVLRALLAGEGGPSPAVLLRAPFIADCLGMTGEAAKAAAEAAAASVQARALRAWEQAVAREGGDRSLQLARVQDASSAVYLVRAPVRPMNTAEMRGLVITPVAEDEQEGQTLPPRPATWAPSPAP